MDKINFDTIPFAVIVIGISVIMIAALAITQSGLGDTTSKCYNSSWAWNTTDNACYNATPVTGSSGTSNLNMSAQYYAIRQAGQGNVSISNQMPTVAIIVVMTLIIGLIAGLYYKFRE